MILSIVPSTLVWFVEPAAAQVSCGGVLTADTLLTGDLTCFGDGLIIGGEDVTLDCAGHAIRGPGTPVGTGLSVFDVSGATITGCRITGFRTAIQAQNAADLRIAGSTISGLFGGIRCAGCSRTTIEGNQLDGNFAQIDLVGSADARIIGNLARPHSKGGGHFAFRYSPRASIIDNRAPEGGAALFLFESDDSFIQENDLARNATVELFGSDRCRIERNRLVRGSAPQPNFGGFVRLSGAGDNVIVGNQIEGAIAMFLSVGWVDSSPGQPLPVGSDRNIIEMNEIKDSGLGLLLFGASENRVAGNRIERTELPLHMSGYFEPQSNIHVPASDNVVEANSIRDGLMGVVLWRASRNLLYRNEILDHSIGVFEGPADPFSSTPNVHRENILAGNGYFGLLIYGSSPVLERNEFRGNGSRDPLPDGLDPFTALLGERRGGVALMPQAGDDFTLDDAEPTNDWPASPVIGGPGGKNLFEENEPVDVYALDTPAANAATLERDNQFKRTGGIRIQQDWFGLVRVEDGDGNPIAEAEVEVRDATGSVAARFTTGASGVGPVSADTGRSQGLGVREEGGPVSAWPRFTEFTVDGRGRRQGFAPYTIVVDARGEGGCAEYSWNGMPDKAPGPQSPDGRYQIAIVRLGSTCPVTAVDSP